nr:uncharacterized protein CTRU02_11767 [Colletotrichum truncatum]KAF6785467.1 hypothetical protein CTRU02_11767 [Colletotrichum truncatum]
MTSHITVHPVIASIAIPPSTPPTMVPTGDCDVDLLPTISTVGVDVDDGSEGDDVDDDSLWEVEEDDVPEDEVDDVRLTLAEVLDSVFTVVLNHTVGSQERPSSRHPRSVFVPDVPSFRRKIVTDTCVIEICARNLDPAILVHFRDLEGILAPKLTFID